MIEKENIKKKTPKKTAGRPDKITPELLAKLEEWFMLSLTDDECCLYCDINPSTLYRYIEKNPAFWKRREILKRTPNIIAKKNWTDEIKQGNYNSSKEWLERKAKDEFSTKVENDTKIQWEFTLGWVLNTLWDAKADLTLEWGKDLIWPVDNVKDVA